jgi:hypothetical protein
MQLKAPSLLPVGIKDARGLAFSDAAAYTLRPALFEVPLAAVPAGEAGGSVVLEAGEETRVDVPLPDLPVNADVRSVTAALVVAATPTAAAAEPATVTVLQGQSEQSFRLQVAHPPGPRNLTIRLDQGEPFWSHGGTLPPGRHELPDFARHLNDYLDRADAGQEPLVLRFMVASDVGAAVRLEVGPVRFSQLQTQTWRNPLDDTIRLDRNLPVGFASVERLELDPIREPRPQLARTVVRMDVGGTLGSERLLGRVRGHGGGQFATVTVDYALAQQLQPPVALQTTGLVAFLHALDAAEVYAELAQGGATTGPEPRQALASANLQVDPSTAQGAWTFLKLGSPVDLEPGRTYWLVVKGVRGTVLVGLAPDQDGHLGQVMVNRGGRLWRSLSQGAGRPLTALLGLIYQPGPDNQTAALELGLEGGPPPQRMDLGDGVRTVVLDAAALDAADPATVVLRSHASGTLSIANVVQGYERADAGGSR